MPMHANGKRLPPRRHPALRGVAPEWDAVLDDTRHSGGTTPRAALNRALAAVEHDAGRLEPPVPLVLEALRYAHPLEIVFVVIGQDPYPRDAMGLCFSAAPGRPVPPSLRRIFAALGRARLRPKTEAALARGVSEVTDLRAWAVQGGLLLNTALTTRTGTRRAHVHEWRKEGFVPRLVAALAGHCARHGRRIAFMLWGTDAGKLGKDVARATRGEATQHLVLRWSHPSPMADNSLPPAARFASCPHFADVNALLDAEGRRPIVWDLLADSLVFTDGGCKGNGGPAPDASYAVCMAGGPGGGTELCGRVAPSEYGFIDEAAPELGFGPVSGAPVPPSNNRGEYLAWCWGALLLLRARAAGRCEIVTDCLLIVRTLTEWLPARRAKGTAHKLRNYDLLRIADALLAALRARCAFGGAGITLTHVNAAHDRPRPGDGAPRRERMLWAGNHQADQLADSVIGGKRAAITPPEDRTWEVRVAALVPALRWTGPPAAE